MAELDFLSPTNVRSDSRFQPTGKSPMHRRLQEAGAEFEERNGWLVAVRVPGEEHRALGIRDVTHAYAVYEGEDGGWLDVPEGHVHQVPSGHTFIAVPSARGAAIPEDFLDMTAAYAALEIAGAGAETVMCRLTALDLTDLPAVGPVAHVRAFVFRAGAESFLVFFPQEYGHYLWEVAVDAAEPLSGGPRGFAASRETSKEEKAGEGSGE